MLNTHEISCKRGSHLLWENLHLKVLPGEVLFVKGENGTGKSSLLRMLAGLLLPYEGSISWNDLDIHQHRYEYHEQLLYIGHQVALKPELNAIENLSSLLLLQGNNPSLTEIKHALEKWLILGNTIHLPTKQLSQGQKQRVALAQLTLSSRALWILDEPFNGLDAQGANILKEHLVQHHAAQKMTIITSHLHDNLQSMLPSLLAQEKILAL